MKVNINIILFFFLAIALACSNQKIRQTISGEALAFADTACGDSSKVIKRVIEQFGIIRYSKKYNQYIVTVPNSFDSFDNGFACNLPEKLKVDGTKVILDGEYRKYDKALVPPTSAGQAYYYLKITRIVL